MGTQPSPCSKPSLTVALLTCGSSTGTLSTSACCCTGPMPPSHQRFQYSLLLPAWGRWLVLSLTLPSWMAVLSFGKREPGFGGAGEGVGSWLGQLCGLCGAASAGHDPLGATRHWKPTAAWSPPTTRVPPALGSYHNWEHTRTSSPVLLDPWELTITGIPLPPNSHQPWELLGWGGSGLSEVQLLISPPAQIPLPGPGPVPVGSQGGAACRGGWQGHSPTLPCTRNILVLPAWPAGSAGVRTGRSTPCLLSQPQHQPSPAAELGRDLQSPWWCG